MRIFSRKQDRYREPVPSEHALPDTVGPQRPLLQRQARPDDLLQARPGAGTGAGRPAHDFSRMPLYPDRGGGGKQLLSHELAHPVQQHPGKIHRSPQGPKLGKPTISTDMEQAREKGREIGELINAGKWKPGNNERLVHWVEFFEGAARESFLHGIQDTTGKKIEEFEGEGREHKDEFATSADTNLIIPTSEARVARGGFKVAYAAQVYEEASESSSHSTSVEVYTDVSGGAGLSVEVPVLKVAKFKIGGEAKGGRRSVERDEEKKEQKKANRSGRTVSRSFTIQKLERDVLDYRYVKKYVAPAPIAKEVVRTPVGHQTEVQSGFRIVPDEGGAPWGPFWNVFSGTLQVEGSALPHVWEVLTQQQKTIAEDLVFGRL